MYQKPHIHILTTLLFVICIIQVNAQQLTTEEILTPNGTEYRYLAIGGPEIPWDTLPSGVYALWDYTDLAINSSNQVLVSAIDPLDVPGTTVFDEADYVLRTEITSTQQTVYDFFDQQADRLLDLGRIIPTAVTVATDPSIALGLPMVLGDTVHEPWCHTLFSNVGIPDYSFCGDSYVTFDLVGTLITPFGTYPDCKHITRKKSAMWVTDWPQDSTFTIQQLWYTPGLTQPVLIIEISGVTATITYASGRVIDTDALSGVEEGASQILQLGPNPTTGMLRLDLLPTARSIEVLDAMGRTVLQRLVAASDYRSTWLDLTALVDGAYTVRLDLGGRRIHRSVIKCK